MRTLLTFLIAASVAGCSAQAGEDGFFHESGSLGTGDETLRTDEYADRYPVSAEAGQWIEVSMTSDAVDPYLILQPPGCEPDTGGACAGQLDNDDFDSADRRAYLWVQAPASGTWTILATSAAPGETGDYELAYRVAEAGERPLTAGVEEITPSLDHAARGTLASGDKTLQSGEFVDYHTFFGRQGQAVSIDLRSTVFDPYLLFLMPNDDQLDNDDYEGDQSRSRIETTLPVDGLYRVGVTSYQPGESGAYTLQVTGSAGAPAGDGTADPFTKQ